MNASRGWRGAAAGAAAAVLGAGAGELVAAVVAPTSSPFAVIGGALIDVAPSWAKDAAIAWFGTSDKIALLTAIGVVLLILGAAAGICEARRPRVGVVVFVAVGISVGGLALTRHDAGSLALVPAYSPAQPGRSRCGCWPERGRGPGRMAPASRPGGPSSPGPSARPQSAW